MLIQNNQFFLLLQFTCKDVYFSEIDAAIELAALEEIDDEEAFSISSPTAMPPSSTSLREFVDKSETLSKLVQLGNDVSNQTYILYLLICCILYIHYMLRCDSIFQV